MIAEFDANIWEKMLGGQAGFILATVLFGLFFWRCLLPRWDGAVKEIARLADAVNTLVAQSSSENQKILKDIMDKLNHKQ